MRSTPGQAAGAGAAGSAPAGQAEAVDQAVRVDGHADAQLGPPADRHDKDQRVGVLVVIESTWGRR